MKATLAFLVIATCSAGVLHAANPAWWTSDQTRIIDPGAPQNNYGPANLGQLKHMAQQAMEYLDLALATSGSAGSEITAMVNAFSRDAAQNAAPTNLGQLKAVAKPFYLRLVAVGYNTRQNLVNHGAPGWTEYYPWLPSTPAVQNYAPANIGQLKFVFSFDLAGFIPTLDADEDTLPNDWEFLYGLDPFSPAPAGDANGHLDGDGVPNREDSRPADLNYGRLTVSITSPGDGSVFP